MTHIQWPLLWQNSYPSRRKANRLVNLNKRRTSQGDGFLVLILCMMPLCQVTALASLHVGLLLYTFLPALWDKKIGTGDLMSINRS